MKKQTFLIVLALAFTMPLMSFNKNLKTVEKPLTLLPKLKYQASVQAGTFVRDGFTYLVYVNNVTNKASEVYYWSGGGWMAVYVFNFGDWAPGNPLYIAHLQIKRLSTSAYFVYTGQLSSPANEA